MSDEKKTKAERTPSPTPASGQSLFRAYWELCRMHKFPLGNILVFWPCAWALAIAAPNVGMPLDKLLWETLVFAVGSTLVHSAACVINDICDVDFDRQVERCKNRPLVTGRVSIPAAWVFLFILTGAAMSLLLFTNRTAQIYGIIGIFPLHALYPLMKRITYWPQAWLGLAMNWGLFVAWYTVNPNGNSEGLWPFFFGTVAWTIVYDTIYACQDRKDDSKAGVRSTALLFGDYVKPILALFAIFFIGTLANIGHIHGQGLPFWVVSIGGTVLFYIHEFITWDPDNVQDCGQKFKDNGNMGYIIWAGLILDYYLKLQQ
ncbi:4-hydroxybenzoate polyprenyl transferase [Panus rudis PR-1116 ss-1]|nr:4-hydroxybenzoate polyprenyl transferase [Panus rudis PR-1116 ss-1]WJQ78191.1 UbiA-type prenyltransferase [Panus rudis]